MNSRKIERKNRRKEKKMRRNMFYNKKMNSINNSYNNNNNNNNNEVIEPNVEQKVKFISKVSKKSNNDNKCGNNSHKNVKKDLKNKNKNLRSNERNKRLIKDEEILIKRYEKKLKLNKRKKKGTLPKSFHLDGLGYVLDVVNNTNIYDDNHYTHFDDKDDGNSDDQSEASEELDPHFGDEEGNDSERSDEEGNDSERSDSHNEDNEDSEQDMDCSESQKEETVKEPQKHKLKEDIYGLVRDSSGRVMKEDKGEGKPHIFKSNDINEQLLRQIRGALNRLTVNNMLTISAQIEEIFKQKSRHEVNEALWSCINSSLIDLEYSAPIKLTSEICLLIAVLHFTVGDEVGGHAIHTLIRKFDHSLKQSQQLNDSKVIDNLVLIIINLYVCGLIESVLVYDIISKLCDIFNEKCIELINLILKSVGFVLRKDNAIKMKELVLNVQKLALNVNKDNLSGNRINYVLESLIAIKNNNMSKVKGYGTVVQVEVIENTLKSTIKKIRVNSIPGRYDAILQSAHWYSYTQNIESLSDPKSESNLDTCVEMNDRLLKALRLNTPLRKTIFIALSTCNDYIEAAHRLISIGKKQFSEVINVLLHVAIHEKHYNPFYLYLFQHLSKCDRKFKIALDFSIRDKISELESLELSERNVLAKLIFQLLKLNVLSITCLKVVHFSDMNQTYVHFIKAIITPIFDEKEELIQQILSKIPNKDSFATAIRLFISCFIDSKYRNKMNNVKELQMKLK